MLALEVKLEEKDKTLLLLSSLPSSYGHLATTIMYGKEILELKVVMQMIQKNELIKKTGYTEDASGLVVKGQMGRSKSKGLKRDQRLLAVFLTIFAKNQSISRRIV